MSVTRRSILIHALLNRRQFSGLCLALTYSIYRTVGHTIKVCDCFPKFTLQNAKRFGAEETLYWWKPNTWGIFYGRTRFLLWLIKEYWTDKTDCKELE